MTSSVKNSRGFTLLELILSMAIVGFIVAISLGAIRLGISTQEVGRQKTETYQRLRIIGEHLSQKIKSSYPKLVPPPKILSLSTGAAVGSSKQLLAFEGKKNSIRFVTFASPIASTDNSVWAHEVKFYRGEHPKSGKNGIIMMEKDISPGNIFTKTPSSPANERYYLLAEDVAYLDFRYYITKKISPVEAGLQKEAPAYEGKWVDQILFNPPDSSQTGYEPGKDKPLPNDSVLTLPKGVEFSLGLLEPVAKGSDKKPKLISSPPVLLLLHSGMEFSLPIQEENDEENNAPS
jgi:prepilin-type N-terminal cleavage/methylation domain-containing protein